MRRQKRGVNFWLEVLTDLQNCGVEDIMIAVWMVLKAFLMLSGAFSPYGRKLCVVHQIRKVTKNKGVFPTYTALEKLVWPIETSARNGLATI